MIDALIGGKLYGTAQQRTAQNGKGFVTAKVRASASDGEVFFVNVITFSESTGAALLALGDGDTVALSGTLTPKVWTDRSGETRPTLDLMAHAVLSAIRSSGGARPCAPRPGRARQTTRRLRSTMTICEARPRARGSSGVIGERG
ncbi:single-stranded DNA-binding protein [Paraburkholderia sacchari]|uniref:single-stranded DNA-binding protein n=1 Tax=Paraburkholderia sacchari TaxID=159450 RepID=UPI003D95D25B